MNVRSPKVWLVLILRTCFAFAALSVMAVVLTAGFVIARFGGTGTLPADCGIVFGAAVHVQMDGSGHIIGTQAGPGIERRIQTAVDFYRDGQLKTLFLTGGKGEGMQQSEAVVMRDLAVREGVPSHDMVMEDQSRSTKENLLNTRPLVKDCRNVVAISDDYHLARIEYLAHQQGWDLKTIPSAWHPDISFEAQSVFREALGILYYTVYR